GGAPLESGHHFESQAIQRIQNVFGRTLRRHEHEIRDAVTKCIAIAKTRIPEELHPHQRLLLRNAKLLCLSEVHDNILMWSHYAQNHSGASMRGISAPHSEVF